MLVQTIAQLGANRKPGAELGQKGREHILRHFSRDRTAENDLAGLAPGRRPLRRGDDAKGKQCHEHDDENATVRVRFRVPDGIRGPLK